MRPKLIILWGMVPLLFVQSALALTKEEFQKLHRELQPNPKATDKEEEIRFRETKQKKF